jgi:hypothetical protein
LPHAPHGPMAADACRSVHRGCRLCCSLPVGVVAKPAVGQGHVELRRRV